MKRMGNNIGWCSCCCVGMHFFCSFLILLQLLFLCVDGKNPVSNGFISIDCGLPSNESYVNSITRLTYVSDDQFIDTGKTGTIDSSITVNLTEFPYLNTLRSFPNGTRNCYKITPATEGSKVLVRAWFIYGNYDQLNKPPRFDLYFGVNLWLTVSIPESDYWYTFETIAVVSNNYIQVCLVNTELGTPFISALEVRPLNSTLYELANSTQSLTLETRQNVGSNNTLLRYPDDTLDRLWPNYTKSSWNAISTSSSIDGFTFNEVPASLLQTAAVSSSSPIGVSWQTIGISDICFVVLYFAEIRILQNTSLREFFIYVDGKQISSNPVPILKYLKPAYHYYTDTRHTYYTFLLESSPRATLPPILNAFEIYWITPVIALPTDNGDVTAINSIKTTYSISENWNGDPCVPTNFIWTGVSCTNNSSNVPRITALNLSSSGLTGAMVSAFGYLTELETLNLSQNSLSGDIPSSLDQLTSLKILDLSGNSNLSMTLPPGLQQKQNDGQLKVITPVGPDHKKSSKAVTFGIVAAVIVLLIIGAVVLFFLYLKKKRNTRLNPPTSHKNPPIVFDKKQYSYEELKLITNDFSETIGSGGFGEVFKGQLGDGTVVAVKVSSESSFQGNEQFLNEVEKLSRVHHKNLLSLVGYCKDGSCIALIYEYMQEGNLQDWLRGTVQSLSWKQRLQIAYESAQGLEYLHKMCSPPLIHRDVKTTNILLTKSLEAKVSDFGLVRDCSTTHVSTRIAGTPGYLDPYYASTNQLTEKSDVYSFGVVLLEIITAKPPIGQDLELGQHLTQFVQQKLSKGNIESILDPNMRNQYNLNSIWKVADLALRCTNYPAKRPDMTEVIRELKDSLNLENFSIGTYSVASEGTSEYSCYSTNENPIGGAIPSDSSEMTYIGSNKLPDSGPLAR